MTENSAAARPVVTRTLGEGDDLLHHDVHGDLADATPDRPALFAFGSPMEAAPFRALADRFPDRPVVTYDPRGAGRNPTGTTPLTYHQHAADVLRVVAALDTHPMDVFATSGGAVVALTVLEQRPDVFRRVVAHEPPLRDLLPDREVLGALGRDQAATYAREGEGPAMAKFITLVMHAGEVPADFADRPAPDPAAFGLPTEDDGVRTSPLMRNIAGTIDHSVDHDRLAGLDRLAERLVIAVGTGTGEEYTGRSARAVAARIGCPLVEFPSHHAGFTEGGHAPGEPDAFAARLREVLEQVSG